MKLNRIRKRKKFRTKYHTSDRYCFFAVNIFYGGN